MGHKYIKKTGLEGVSDTEMKLAAPKSCSFKIQIDQVAAGEDFSFLVTKKGLLYAMGNNQFGKLGISNSKTTIGHG